MPAHPAALMATNRPPDYPAAARRRGEQGRVILRVSIGSNGEPLAVVVAQSSGHELLDDAAVRAVRRWRFVPAERDGHPVPTAVNVPIRFRLEQ